MKPENRSYFAEIDGLRALAVLSVIIFHYDDTYFSGGFIGVDIFFVISGFLITLNISNDIRERRFSFKGFYYRRIRRLFPAMFFTLILSCIAGILLLSPQHLERFSGSIVYSTFSLSNFYFYREAGYFDTSSSFKPLLHYWSLSVEEQFYIVWPLLLVLLLKFNSRMVLYSTLVIVSILSIGLSEFWLSRNPAVPFFITPFRVAEFSIGALCVWLARYHLNKRILEIGFLISIAALFYCIFNYDKDTLFPGVNSLLPCLATGLFILTRHAPISATPFRTRVATRIGVISYSLYLLHWPILIFYSYWAFTPISIYEKAALLVLTYIGAELMYRYIEQYFRLTSHSKVTKKSFATGMMLIIVVVLVPTIHAWNNDGWKWRVPNNQQLEVEVSNFGCDKNITVTRFESKCQLGSSDSTPRKILMIGDSHAMHLTTGLSYLAKKYNYSIEFSHHTGCPPLWGTYKLQDSKSRDSEISCKHMVPKWEALIESGKYDFIILASRWMWLYEPDTYSGVKVRRELLVDRDSPNISVEASQELFKKRLKLTIDKIHESGAKAIVFSQPPLLAKNIQDCNRVPTFMYSTQQYNMRCDGNVTYIETKQRLEFTDRFIKSLAGKDTLAILPSVYMCDSEKEFCLTTYDKAALYKDDNHLSKEGSLFLAKWIENDFHNFIK